MPAKEAVRMNHFDQLLSRAVDEVKSTDFPKTYSVNDTKATVAGIKRLSFSGLLSILGVGVFENGSDGGHTYLDAAVNALAQDKLSKESGISKHQIVGFLKNVFRRRISPSNLISHDQIRRAILGRALQMLAREAGITTVTDQQVDEIVRLLETGKFFDDISSSTAAVVSTIQGIPIRLVKDISPNNLSQVAFRIGAALPKDLGEASAFLSIEVLEDLFDKGQIDHAPGLLIHTFAVLYDLATVESTAEMVRSLIHPENRTVRIAIMIYARANGVKLEDKDLDAVYEALNPSNPNLAPLVTAATRNLSQRYAPEDGLRLLDRMRSRV
jgi:hypothetical protein